MKTRLSGREKALIAVPLLGVLVAWQGSSIQHAWYLVFPNTTLPLGPGDLDGARFSPDGKILVAQLDEWETPVAPQTSQMHSGFAMWEARSGETLWRTPPARADKQRNFQDPVFSPDSALLLFCDARTTYPARGPVTNHTTLWLYDAVSGKPRRSFAVGNTNSAQFVDGGRKILCNGSPSRILDAVTGKTLATTRGYAPERLARPLSADGKMGLLLRENKGRQGGSRQMEVWDFSKPRKIRTFQGTHWHVSEFDGWVRIYALSPDGKFACTVADGQGAAEIWDVTTGRVTHTLPVRNLYSVAYSPDSRYLLMRCSAPATPREKRVDRISVWDSRTAALLWTQMAPREPRYGEHAFAKVLFSPDGKYVVTTGSEGSAVRWLDIRSGKVMYRLGDASNVVFSPEGRTMAIALANEVRIRPAALGGPRS